MAHSPPAPSQPPLPPSLQNSFARGYQVPNGRPSPLGPHSPQIAMNYSSPSPQAFSPPNDPYFQHPPASKRPRLSPDGQSPLAPQSFPGTPTGQPGTPSGHGYPNGLHAPAAMSAMMPPPQRPLTGKDGPGPVKEDRDYENILQGTGINIEEEDRMLAQGDYFGGPSMQPARTNGFEYQTNSFSQPGVNGGPYGMQQQNGAQNYVPEHQPTAEELQRRTEERRDWEASRHGQHPLWDMFLLGGTLNDRIRNISIREHLVDPQSGVLVNTQKHMPPPMVRVNGLEGASRVIDKGQAILDSGAKGERLSDLMKVITLATKSRLTGVLSGSARLAKERCQHSQGQVPDEWQDLAVPVKPATEAPNGVPSPAGSGSLKRTHSQANSEADRVPNALRLVATFDKSSTTEKSADDARRQKRLKRRTTTKDDPAATPAGDGTPDPMAVTPDTEKKTTKKERKAAETKFSEQQQHKSANEAARMAVSGLLGSRLGGKKAGRTYDWMNAGKGGASPVVTPGKPPPSGPTSTAGTPKAGPSRAVSKEKHFGQWDENKDARVQARDILLVLERDGRASRAFVRGLNSAEKPDS